MRRMMLLGLLVVFSSGCEEQSNKQSDGPESAQSKKSKKTKKAPVEAKKGEGPKLDGDATGCMVHDGDTKAECYEYLAGDAASQQRAERSCKEMEGNPKFLSDGCPNEGALGVCMKKGAKSRRVIYSKAEGYFGADYDPNKSCSDSGGKYTKL